MGVYFQSYTLRRVSLGDDSGAPDEAEMTALFEGIDAGIMQIAAEAASDSISLEDRVEAALAEDLEPSDVTYTMAFLDTNPQTVPVGAPVAPGTCLHPRSDSTGGLRKRHAAFA